MKYGQELSRRSVPEWRTRNLDYNEIKKLIKKATSPKATRVHINNVVKGLFSEYEALSLFVKSKTLEIDRRIQECHKIFKAIVEKDSRAKAQAEALAGMSGTASHSGGSTSGRGNGFGGAGLVPQRSESKSRRYYVLRLHRDLARISNDLHSLSRFVAAQRTGFRKLLKKYKKWSGSSELSTRFLPTLESPTSFTNLDLTSRFLELSMLQDALRQSEQDDSSAGLGDISVGSSSPASKRRQAPLTPAQQAQAEFTTFDSDFSMAPASQSATFWIHQDNVMEVKMTLQQHLTAVAPQGADAYKDTSTIYLDDRKFRAIQTDTEPGSILWVSEASRDQDPPPKASHLALCSPTGGIRQFASTILTPELTKKILSSSVSRDTVDQVEDSNGRLAVGWILQRKAIPVSKLSTSRSRFRLEKPQQVSQPLQSSPDGTAGAAGSAPTSSGLSSALTKDPHIWARIDNDIRMTSDATNTQTVKINASPKPFPHAVLEIRWTGMEKPQWIKELEKASHLVKFMPDFSLYSHTIAVFHADALQGLPSWLDLIKQDTDIRGAPQVEDAPDIGPGRLSRKSSRQRVGGVSGLTTTDSSTASTGGPGTSQTAAGSGHGAAGGGILRNQIQTPGGILLNDNNNNLNLPPAPGLGDVTTVSSENNSVSSANMFSKLSASSKGVKGISPQEHAKPIVRYWNEFDDPEDGDTGFYIDASDPGAQEGIFNDKVDNLVRATDNFVRGISKIGTYFGLSSSHNRSRGLLSSDYDSDDDDYDGAVTEENSESDSGARVGRPYSPRVKSRYNTFDDDVEDLNLSTNQDTRRAKVLTFLYSTCFFVATLILGILYGVITGEDMNIVSVAVFAFIMIGFIFSLLVSMLGLGLFLLRDPPDWLHQTVVFTVFFSLVCFDVGALAWLVST